MASLRTVSYKTLPNDLPLQLDIDTLSAALASLGSTILDLSYFCAGYLINYNRNLVFPHIVQACLSRGWTCEC